MRFFTTCAAGLTGLLAAADLSAQQTPLSAMTTPVIPADAAGTGTTSAPVLPGTPAPGAEMRFVPTFPAVENSQAATISATVRELTPVQRTGVTSVPVLPTAAGPRAEMVSTAVMQVTEAPRAGVKTPPVVPAEEGAKPGSAPAQAREVKPDPFAGGQAGTPGAPGTGPKQKPTRPVPADPFAPAPVPGQTPPSADPFAADGGGGGAELPTVDKAEPQDGATHGFNELLMTWTAYSMTPATARKAVIALPKQGALYRWCAEQAARPESGVKMEFVSSMNIRSGQRSKSNSNDEFAYPTEFDPPQIPQTFGVVSGAPASEKKGQNPPEASGTVPAPGTTIAVAPPLATPPRPLLPTMVTEPGEIAAAPFCDALTPWPMTFTTPSSFTFRYLGLTIEMEATTGESGKVADVNAAPEFVKLLKVVPWTRAGDCVQPVFSAQKLSTQIYAPVNRPSLVGTFNRGVNTGAPGGGTTPNVWLLFLTPTTP